MRGPEARRWFSFVAFWGACVVVGAVLVWLATGAVSRMTGRPPALPVQILIFAAVWFLLPVVGFGLLRLRHGLHRPPAPPHGPHGPHGPHERRHPFREVADALDRIAAGDFDVVLDSWGGRNEFAERINRMARQLSSMEHMRQDFVSNVSHEIRSPLTSIRGFAELLKKSDLPAGERLRYAEVIETEAGRLFRLSDNLLRLSLLDSDPGAFTAAPYRLDRQLENVLLMLEPQWSAKAVEPEADLEAVTLRGDEDLLEQVWINLLHNAIRFTPPGGKIAVKLRREGDEAVCAVSDTGIGIAEADLVHVFERFYKADRARSNGGGGSGLGLALVKKIATVHGGSVLAKSEPGAGSVFTVRLPGVCEAS